MNKTFEHLVNPGSEQQSIVENVSRRNMLKGMFATGGLVLAAQLVPGEAGAVPFKPYKTGADGMPGGWVWDPHVFVSIAPDGTVSIVTHRSEMGTGSRTSLPMVVADEMEADWHRVKIVQAPGDEKKYGNQDTDGSRSMRHFIQPMRACGAAARQMLEAAAAAKWGVDVGQVEAKNHEVHLKGGSKKLGFGELAADAAAMATPAADSLKLKDPKEWKYIGKGKTPITDLNAIITGHTQYAQDIVKPGMLFAVVDRPPVLLDSVASYDEAAAMAVPGVVKVVKLDPTPPPFKFAPKGGVAVIAKNTWAALKGREALKTQWKGDSPNAGYNSDAFKAAMLETASKPGKVERKEGDVDGALKTADKVVEHSYYVPHFAHATMEPPAATVIVNGDKAEVWACVQSPGGTRGDVAKTLNLKEEDVTVNVTLLGGGFGRKSKCDFALEAAILAKGMPGTPIKVVWTREDDLKHSFYHSVSAQNVTAGVKDKKVVAFRHRSVSPSLMSNFMPDPKRESALELGLGLIDTPYDVPNLQLETGEAVAHTRIGWFRSVNNIPHAFAAQSFISELAHELGRDPKEFLLEMIGPARIVDVTKTATSEPWNYGDPYSTYPIDTGRLRNVVERAAKEAGWGRKMPKGSGLGIAVQRSFLTYVATVVEVRVDDKGNLEVPAVHTAIDAGFIANPERVRSQVEGGAVMGLSIAKYGEITFKNGAAVQNNFNDYKVLRIGQGAMNVHTHIIEHHFGDKPSSGVGEPPVPPFAPALCNAIFAATGKRIRELPIGDTIKV